MHKCKCIITIFYHKLLIKIQNCFRQVSIFSIIIFLHVCKPAKCIALSFTFIEVHYICSYIVQIKLNVSLIRASGNILHLLVSDSQNILFPPCLLFVLPPLIILLLHLLFFIGFQCNCFLVLSLIDSRTVLLHCLDQNSLAQATANKSF